MHQKRVFHWHAPQFRNNGLKIKAPKVGDRYTLGNSDFIIISPASENHNNLNDYSVGIKLNHGDNSFIFTGDAEATSENEMVNSGIDLRANVLKVPHHGSSSSSTDSFLKAVNPKIAIFSLGENNSYGHPHREIIKKYENIETYRTDIHGTILVISNGIEVIVKTEKNSEINISENKESENKSNEMFYIGNKNSKVFHLDSCNTLPAEQNRIIFKDREDAIDSDFRPCGRCKP